MSTKNPFDIFNAKEERTAFIKTLDAEITYHELTMKESDAYNKRLLKDYKGKGDPNIDLVEATKITYEKIAACLISPAMTVADLQNLGSSASKAINEIAKLIEGTTEDLVDEETGNSDD